MTDTLLLPREFLWPAWWAVAVYGGRYLLMAALLFAVARPVPGGGWGRPHATAPARLSWALHLRREMGYSLVTVLVFGLINGLLFVTGAFGHSLMYFQWNAYPVWWFLLSIGVMLLLHDTLFYWLHRCMHHPVIYQRVHRVHHLSVHPTAFAAYSFHPWEAAAEALIVTVIIYLIPTHPLSFLVFQTISTAYNVYGHCGREFWPAGMQSHWLGRWINTSTTHAVHHHRGRFNYGLYFMLWDRWMGTAEPAPPSR